MTSNYIAKFITVFMLVIIVVFAIWFSKPMVIEPSLPANLKKILGAFYFRRIINQEIPQSITNVSGFCAVDAESGHLTIRFDYQGPIEDSMQQLNWHLCLNSTEELNCQYVEQCSHKFCSPRSSASTIEVDATAQMGMLISRPCRRGRGSTN